MGGRVVGFGRRRHSSLWCWPSGCCPSRGVLRWRSTSVPRCSCMRPGYLSSNVCRAQGLLRKDETRTRIPCPDHHDFLYRECLNCGRSGTGQVYASLTWLLTQTTGSLVVNPTLHTGVQHRVVDDKPKVVQTQRKVTSRTVVASFVASSANLPLA